LKGFENIYGGSGFMAYPTFPMQYPTNGDYPAPMGLIPVELDIEGLYEDHDRRRRKNGNEKIVASHVHSVYTQSTITTLYMQFFLHLADINSVAELRTELRRGHLGTGRRST
jgi:hypothetical protein